MKILLVDNYYIEEPIINIIYHIKDLLNNGKLRDIIDKGDELVVTCPNDEHGGGQEHTPDHHINLDDTGNVSYGITNCFACGSSGSFVHFVALCFSSSIDYAKKWLIKNYGKLSHEKLFIGDKIKLSKSEKQTKYLDKSILEGLQDWTPYLGKRGLDRTICNNFHVKYDNVNRQVVFPVYDLAGNLLMAPRRSIDTKFFMLGEDIAKPIYGLNVIQKNNVKSCLVVEGPIDMLACFSHGVPAIALFGSPATTQIEQINKSCITFLYLACDNDAAGRKFNQEIKRQLDKRILVYEVSWPSSCKDAADLTEEQWDEVIKTQHLPKLF